MPVCLGPLFPPLSKNWGYLFLLERCWNPQNQKADDDFLICREGHSELVFPPRGQRGKNLTLFSTSILGWNWLEVMENLLMKIMQTLVLCVNQVSLF